MLLSTPASLLVYIFSWLLGSVNVDFGKLQLQTPKTLKFELRHLHAISTNNTGHIIFSDSSQIPNSNIRIPHGDAFYSVKTRYVKTFTPSSFEAHARARSRSMRFGETEILDWMEGETMAPDVEDRETLLGLAKMTNNAYVEPDDPAWYDIGSWNIVRFPSFLPLYIFNLNYSLIPLVGSQTPTVSEATSLQLRTTPQSPFP